MKTLQWTFVSWLLYTEAFLVALFLLPWIRARTWKRLLKSRFLRTISSKVGHYLWAILVGLLILFLDAVREARENYYSDDVQVGDNRVEVDFSHHLRLYHGQRNLMITAGAFLLGLILKRFIKITLLNANYEEAIEASMGKQCRLKVEVNFLMKAKYTMCRLNGIPFQRSIDEEMDELARIRDELTREVEKAKTDRDAMGKQKAGLERQFDELTKKSAEGSEVSEAVVLNRKRLQPEEARKSK